MTRFSSQEIIDRAGRVGVLMGGQSAEREISLKSGNQIHTALTRAGIEAVAMLWEDDVLETLSSARIDRIFIALHGRGGEDGHLQGMLDLMKIPYTGSGVLGSALAMDKIRCKQLWHSLGIPTPHFATVKRAAQTLRDDVPNFPVMVKPAREGSSIGITKVNGKSELNDAIRKASKYDDDVLIEQWIAGEEYTLSILGDETLPIIKLETPHEFYDFEAKYHADTTNYLCPCGLDEKIEQQFAALGLRAFEAVGASGWGRIDFMVDDAQRPWMIEVNTVPGMTDHSLVPMAAAAAGITFDELVVRILATSLVDKT